LLSQNFESKVVIVIVIYNKSLTRWFGLYDLIFNLESGMQGRIKICEGKNIDRALDEEIHELTEKLKKLQKRSTVKDFEKRRRSSRNFDKQVSVLQRRLEKIGGPSDEIYLREFEEMEKVSFSVKRSSRFDDTVVASGKLNVSVKVTIMFCLICL
jgi:small subunit ribosomal protein S2e